MADRVDFTRSAADRIARVVRLVEQGDRDGAALTYGRVADTLGKSLTLATFTGEWKVNEFKVVCLYGATQTASVLNLCTPSVGFSTNNTAEQRFVIYGKVKRTTDNVVVEIQQAGTSTCTLTLGNVDLTALTGYDSAAIQVLGHAAGDTASTCQGALQWYSVSTCSTSTAYP